jgi:hypothetical protein
MVDQGYDSYRAKSCAVGDGPSPFDRAYALIPKLNEFSRSRGRRTGGALIAPATLARTAALGRPATARL